MSRTIVPGLTLLAILVLGLACGAGPVSASGPETCCDLPLVLVSGSQHVRLTAVTMQADLTCEGSACTLVSTQVYQVRNTSYAESAYLTVGLPVLTNTCQAPDEWSLRESGGTILAPTGASEAYQATWQISIPAGASRTLTVVNTWSFGERRLIEWRWASSSLDAWPSVDGVRAEYRLTGRATDDAFAYVEPACLNFDGTRLIWSYERVEAFPDHSLLMVSPFTLRLLADAQDTGAYHERARLLMEVRSEAEDRHLAIPDPLGEILAALAAASADHPADASVHLDLARAYRAAAATYPDLGVDYLLLAVQELESASALTPADAAITPILAGVYYELALASSEAGAPGAALDYLRRAQAMGADSVSGEDEEIEDLFMRWALELAEQGEVDEALAQVAERLAPGTLDSLLRWAPPVTAVTTEITLGAGSRTVEYGLRPYAPLAPSVQALIDGMAKAWRQVAGCSVTLSSEPSVVTLRVTVNYTSLTDLSEKNAALVDLLPVPRDLVSEIVVAPLAGTVTDFGVTPGLLRDRLIYREEIDLAPVKAVWESQAEYASWRLVELNNLEPVDDRGRLEVDMALMAVRNQAAIWDCVPMGAHLVYTLQSEDTVADAPESVWRAGWGETTDLVLRRSWWHWERVALLILLTAIVLVVLVRALLKRPRRI